MNVRIDSYTLLKKTQVELTSQAVGAKDTVGLRERELSHRRRAARRTTSRSVRRRAEKMLDLGGAASTRAVDDASSRGDHAEEAWASSTARREHSDLDDDVHESYYPSAGFFPRRRSLSSHFADTIAAAGCFSRVKNANDILIGQLIGECASVKVDDATAVNATAPPTLCVPKERTREVFPQYTVPALVERTGFVENGTDKYNLVNIVRNVVDDGSNICGAVPANRIFCPALVAANAASEPQNVGTGACPAIKVLVQQVTAAATTAEPMSSSAILNNLAVIVSTTTTTTTTTLIVLAVARSGDFVTEVPVAQRTVRSSVALIMTIADNATSESLMSNNAFTGALKTAFATSLSTASASIATNDVVINSINLSRLRKLFNKDSAEESGGLGGRRMLSESMVRTSEQDAFIRQLMPELEKDAAIRLLPEATKTVDVDYSVKVPPTFSDQDVNEIAAKSSSGSAQSAGFANTLTAALKSAIAADSSLAGLVTGVEGATVTGTAVVVTEGESEESGCRVRALFPGGGVVAFLVWQFAMMCWAV